jgi:hypothetical protein
VPIDREQALKLSIPPIEVEIEPGRLRLFAKITGQTDPIYSDLTAAFAAGHRGLPIPPTFLFSLELESPDPFAYLAELGVDLRYVLHGEQSFHYEALIYGGDTVTLQSNITDVYARKDGALEFVVKETGITRNNELVGQSQSVIVVRNPVPSS